MVLENDYFSGSDGELGFGIAEGDPGELLFGVNVTVGSEVFGVVEATGDDVDVSGPFGMDVGERRSAVGAKGARGGGFGFVRFWDALDVFEI